MFLKRTSPNLVLTLAGGLEVGDRNPLQAKIVTPVTTEKQVKPCGTCDHNRKQPRSYVPPSHHKPRPSVIGEMQAQLNRAFFRPKKILQKMFLMEHSGKKKKKKSQRREACILVLQVLLQYMDMDTLEIGFYTDAGSFIRLDVDYIAKQAKISQSRAKRALRNISEAGYLESDQQYKRDDDERFIGLPAIRKLTPLFFADLKVDHFKFFSAREWKRKRNEKKLLKHAREKFRFIIKSVTNLGKKASNKNSSLIRKTLLMVEETAKIVANASKAIQLE